MVSTTYGKFMLKYLLNYGMVLPYCSFSQAFKKCTRRSGFINPNVRTYFDHAREILQRCSPLALY